MRGSLWRSSASSKKALSGFTAFLRFDQRGMACEPRTKSRWRPASLLDPKIAKRSQPTMPPTTPERRPPTGTAHPLMLRTGSESLRVAWISREVRSKRQNRRWLLRWPWAARSFCAPDEWFFFRCLRGIHRRYRKWLSFRCCREARPQWVPIAGPWCY